MRLTPEQARTLNAKLKKDNPQIVAVTNTGSYGDAAILRSRTVAAAQGKRPLNANATSDEQAEIARITAEYAGLHGLPAGGDNVPASGSYEDREIARITREQGIQ